MNSDYDIEKALSDFLDRPEYDDVENALFLLVRAAFRAGWDGAGGAPWPEKSILEIYPEDEEE